MYFELTSLKLQCEIYGFLKKLKKSYFTLKRTAAKLWTKEPNVVKFLFQVAKFRDPVINQHL